MAGPGDDDDSERLRDMLAKTRIAPDLLAAMRSKATRADPLKAGAGARYARTGGGRPDPTSAAKPVIIEFNDRFPAGSQTARWVAISAHAAATGAQPPSTASTRVLGTDVPHPALTARIAKCFGKKDVLSIGNSMLTRNYLFGRLSNKSIAKLAASEDGDGNALVHKIWFDHPIQRCVMDSVRTIKCDAARTTFAAAGKGIVWAVADTGVDGAHPHLTTNKTLEVGPGLAHRDFTQDHPDEAASSKAATTDIDGHGTHVAGIIAGASPSGKRTEIHRSVQAGMGMSPVVEIRDEPMYGLAPMCKILSLKVLRDQKDGSLSALLAALGHLQTVNDHGRDLRVHGLNLSLGYPYDPEWFAAGQSPLCVEVDRLVKCGMVVVVAAGNGGYGAVSSYYSGSEYAATTGTIGDPGNADLAITVGSTHRTSPHSFGVSFFSGKGPTADGRLKPDLVAPGERIVSCAPCDADAVARGVVPYREDSGTSMAAPHVSGAAAIFLSARREFIGRPEKLKAILVASATDLKRRPEFQGAGLVDVFRALQSV